LLNGHFFRGKGFDPKNTPLATPLLVSHIFLIASSDLYRTHSSTQIASQNLIKHISMLLSERTASKNREFRKLSANLLQQFFQTCQFTFQREQTSTAIYQIMVSKHAIGVQHLQSTGVHQNIN